MPELSVEDRSPGKSKLHPNKEETSPPSASEHTLDRGESYRTRRAHALAVSHNLIMKTTRWLLDDDFLATHTSGAIEKLALRVEKDSTAVDNSVVFRYDVSCVVDFNRIAVSAGNALVFSKSLILFEIDRFSLSLNAILIPTETGLFASHER